MAFTFTPLRAMPDVVIIESTRHGDARGWFVESYKHSAFAGKGLGVDFLQDNHSFSAEPGILRGLHYQVAPHAQGKLIRVIAGEIFDVVVDIRPASGSFGRWVSVELRGRDQKMIWVPDGFAHGFQTLAPNTEVIYKTTREYSPLHERGIRWDDPSLAIDWPIAQPILADRDKAWPALSGHLLS